MQLGKLIIQSLEKEFFFRQQLTFHDKCQTRSKYAFHSLTFVTSLMTSDDLLSKRKLTQKIPINTSTLMTTEIRKKTWSIYSTRIYMYTLAGISEVTEPGKNIISNTLFLPKSIIPARSSNLECLFIIINISICFW